MKVVILCGGQGTRLREETEFRPKPMIEIGGRPILWHIMKLYARFGLTDFLLCLGYKGHVIKDFFLNYDAAVRDFTIRLGVGSPPTYHDPAPREAWTVTLVDTGPATQTGGRVRRIRRFLDPGEPFCLTYGDGLGDIDIAGLLAFHRRHGRLATVTGVHPPGRFGEIEVGDEAKVLSFTEKPQVSSGLINGGYFVFERDFVESYLDDSDELVLEHAPLQRAASDGQLTVWRHQGFWQPMDTYREWKLLEALWESGQAPWKAWE